MRAERLELVDEAVGPPERRVVGSVGVAAAQLVVEDDAAVGPCKALEGLQVEAAATWASVQEDERALAVAQQAVADDSAFDLDLTVFLGHAPPETARGGPTGRPAPFSSSLVRPLRGRTCPLRRIASATRSSR